MNKIKISLCMCVWNTSHLLKRSVFTYLKQTMPRNEFEIIIIDDNSEDDVLEAIKPIAKELNVVYVRLNHNFGMRGCTYAFNTAFGLAKGKVLAETTPETLLQPETLEVMYEYAMKGRNFVAFKTYNLVHWMQHKIDEIDWKSDIMNCSKLDGWNESYVQCNVANTHFGTHQTCAIKKELFYELWGKDGFVLYGDYGSEDPAYLNIRERAGINDITIMDIMCVHQWHLPFQYWMSKGKAPYLNKWAHSTSNFMNDKSGKVPEQGTRYIWDAAEHEKDFNTPAEYLSKEEKDEWSKYDEDLRKCGCTLI
jgi:glycosyltransferase involved in cell wall biosynthesis